MALELARSWLPHLALDCQLEDSVESSRVEFNSVGIIAAAVRRLGGLGWSSTGVVTTYRKASASGQNARLGLSSHEEAGDI
ncbi:hypothetical protein CPLU01_03892 [Colletotrichum plurivorum]|uniref:Uncharacterized protein n=1 Tax=Colletotrichum plurivorum TaxID=2175906 RepID=A0A8H6NKJ5_9PEZI|nr:hypothetical protein CPLU01_03892 [Colletotrichum plurivorum]